MAGKVKVGVVGCGVVAAAYYLPYLMKMENAELIAVCDRFETRTNACARLFGAKQQYRDYDNMIDRADIEAVLILTAPGTHVPFTLKAVEAGKHVLIQKLMATNMADARKIAAAIRKNKVKALIEPSSSTPLEPAVVQLRQLIKAGGAGRYPVVFAGFHRVDHLRALAGQQCIWSGCLLYQGQRRFPLRFPLRANPDRGGAPASARA